MKTLKRKELSEEIIRKCKDVNRKIWISSPFVGGHNKVLGILGSKFALTTGLDLKLLVDVSDIHNCSYETLNALLDLGFEIKTLTGLHAKIYIIDNESVITSANLTERAFTKKFEIGVSLDKSESKEAISIFNEFFEQGNKVKRFTEKEIKIQKQKAGSRFHGPESGGDAKPFMSILDPQTPQLILPVNERQQALRNFTEENAVWKISLGRRWTEGFVYESCIRTNTIAIGWIDDQDIAGWNYAKILKTLNKAYPGRKRTASANSMYYFTTSMQVGDLVLVYESRDTVRAIGIVEGEYKWVQNLAGNYAHRRKVNWLTHGGDINIYALNNHKHLSESALYELDEINYNKVKSLIMSL